jgi:uncharacterized protein YndB with AHSA1/START domain
MTTTHELMLTRVLDASRHSLYRCWTEPELLKQWFAPAPVTTPIADLDVRVGGAARIVMRLPDGTEIATLGTYLALEPGSKLVFTDAYTGDWQPRTDAPPFMTAIITFEEEEGRTRYTARVRHWTAEDLKRHEQMGFHRGWGQCTDQLVELARQI